MSKRKIYNFRVSCGVLEADALQERCIEFLYYSFSEARKNYKSILLGLYKGRTVAAYRICLNRTRDPSWMRPIYEDQGEK